MSIKGTLILVICLFAVAYTNVLTYTQLTRAHEKELSTLSAKIITTRATLEDTQSLLMKKTLEAHLHINTIEWMKSERERELLESLKDYIIVKYKRDPEQANQIANRVLYNSKKHDLPFTVITAVMETESEFKPTAVSKRGCRGLMQVNPVTWSKTFGFTKNDLHDINTGTDVGSQILKHYVDTSDQDMKKALYKYVGGDSDYYRKVYVNLANFQVYRSMK